jgi:NhaA family Na+:H+ antiporter
MENPMKKSIEVDRSPPPRFRILRPFQEFFQLEASGGILLLVCTIVALVWANSPFADTYTSLWQTRFTIQVGSTFELSKPLILWVNDGLMAVFFFVVGLEIKREVLVGELASLRRAALPISAAVGGVIVPAFIYTLLNGSGAGAAGWGIPIATDIAFALGVMALLGDRVPTSLKVFLTALAIADDITAVLVIALFYTAQIDWTSLLIGFGLLAVLVAANRLGVRHPLVYTVLGVIVWIAFLKSGVHATVAGVLLAMTIPARNLINPGDFLGRSREYLHIFEEASDGGDSVLVNQTRQAAVHALEGACEQVQAPLQRLEHALHSWVAFVIMPVFALANAGVALSGDLAASISQPVTLGVILGLVIGKPLGITLASWLAVRSRLADKPEDIGWIHIHGASWLGGIGFTMSLFIAGLAFGDSPFLDMAKIGILTASLIAGAVGWFLLSRVRAAESIHQDVAVIESH